MSDIMTHVIRPTMDAALQRRPRTWYLGKVMWVKGKMVPPGWPEGYYIPTVYHPEDDSYEYHFCGLTPPPDEAIYIHDGKHLDLRAVPSTVVPGKSTWIFWAAAYAVVATVLAALSADSNPIFVILLYTPLLGIPFFQWYMNVEPVRATKVAAAILTAEVLLAAKHRNDWEKSQASNERYR